MQSDEIDELEARNSIRVAIGVLLIVFMIGFVTGLFAMRFT